MVEEDLRLLLIGIIRAYKEPNNPGKDQYLKEKIFQAEKHLRELYKWEEII